MQVMNDLGLLKPVCLFEQLFNQKLRLNDVPLDQFADFSCSTNVISTAVGSAMVSVGATRVLCGIKAKNTCPRFICNVDHLGLAHRGLRANAAPSKEDQSLAVQLEWLLGSVAVPDATKQLLIYPEDSDCAVATYLLHVDVAIIFDDGCLLDACLAACLAALASATWPRLVVASSDSQIASSAASSLKVQFKEKEESEVVNVVISEWPVALSFAVVPRPPPNAAHELICQPSRSESLLWDTDASTCHFVLNSAGEIIDFSMIGGFASCLWTLLEEASADKSSDIIEEAVQRAIKYAPIVREQLNPTNHSRYLMTAKLYSVVRGKHSRFHVHISNTCILCSKVVSIKEFGAFVSIEGSDRQGLLHRSCISNHPVDDVAEVLEVGERILVKIISDKDGKLGLSMKVVNQTTGEDMDPNNLIIAQMEKRRKGEVRGQSPIRLEAELNTVCKRCGIKGKSSESFIYAFTSIQF
ncbi:unnamed protein product [Mesocestoides corti]|uniref:S1 motif domain-containing protein n=1 Tax=Mesocestoides corti TaxID=53468 RepID=A0A3P6HE80_MESCO|nr:unnamed protein product [Mesocestoides corti]